MVEDYAEAPVVVLPADPIEGVHADDVLPDAGVPTEECFAEAPIA